MSVSPKASRMKVTRGRGGECEPAFDQNALSSLLAYLTGLRGREGWQVVIPTHQAQRRRRNRPAQPFFPPRIRTVLHVFEMKPTRCS